MKLEDVQKKLGDLTSRLEGAETKVKTLEEEKANLIATSKSYGNRSTSIESKSLMYFGAKSAADLIHVNTASPKFKHVPDEVKGAVRSLKEAIDVARWTAQLSGNAPLDSETAFKDSGKAGENFSLKNIGDAIHSTHYAKEELAPILKAFGTGVSGGGAEWVPTAVSSSFIEEFELERGVGNMFKELPMPTSPFDWPIKKNGTKARKSTQNTAMTASNFGTDKLTFTAVKSAEYYEIPEELNEDSAPAILALGRQEVVEAQLRAREAAILNGDTTATHQDADTHALGADVAEKFWKGLRKMALANSGLGITVDASNAVISAALIKSLRSSMGKFGVNPRMLGLIVGPAVLNQLLLLPEVVTVDKFGPAATVVQGSLGNIFGIPIFTSEYIREDLNASGVEDDTTTDRTVCHLVNMSRFWLGMRRPIRSRIMQDLPSQDRWLLASYARSDFQGVINADAEASTAMLYNIATS